MWYCLFIIILSVLFVTFVHIIDFKIPIINPEEETILTYNLYYPSSSSSSIPLINVDVDAGYKKTTSLLFSVDIFLKFKGKNLVAGAPVDIDAQGCVYPKGQEIIGELYSGKEKRVVNKSVSLGIEGASIYNIYGLVYNKSEEDITVNNPGGEFIISLKDCPGPAYSVFIPGTNFTTRRTITWNTEGEWGPYVRFPFSNMSEPLTVKFSDSKIHVLGSHIEREERSSDINFWLSIVLFLFTIIMAIPVLSEIRKILIPDEKCQNKNSEDTDEIKKDNPTETNASLSGDQLHAIEHEKTDTKRSKRKR